jgi:hypothetical protein
VREGISFYQEKNNNEKPVPPNYFASFTDPKLTSLKIKFINAPFAIRNQAWFLAGEVHPNGVDKNPKNNPFSVTIDVKGNGEIVFTQKQCQEFALKEWSDPNALQFKLVETKGKWDFPKESYSEFGNNTINPEYINPDGSVTIDLSIEDYRTGAIRESYSPHVAYMIQNDFEKTDEKIKKLLVIHNFSDEEWKFPIREFSPGEWKTRVDNLRFSQKNIASDFYVVKSHASSILEN